MNADEIVREITQRAWRFGVAVLLSPEASVDCDGLRTSGWFDGEGRRLEVGTGVAEQHWLGVLLHEYSHLTQWAENSPVHVAHEKAANVHEWIMGKTVSKPRQAVAITRELEADCERRTVRLIRELAAPIDIPNYCRQANSYLHFHNVIANKRKWYRPDRTPYKTPEVTILANSTLDTDFRKTPPALYSALLTCI